MNIRNGCLWMKFVIIQEGWVGGKILAMLPFLHELVKEFRVLEAYSLKGGIQVLIPKHLASCRGFRGFGVSKDTHPD